MPFATDFMKQLAKSIYKVSLNYIDGGLCNDSRKYPPKIQVLKFKMMPDLFERFFGNGGDFVDGEVVRVRANWRPLTDLDDVFAYGDSWRKHTGPRHRFVLTRMLVQHTEAGYATFKFAGGLRVYGRNEEGDNEFTALIAPGFISFFFCFVVCCFCVLSFSDAGRPKTTMTNRIEINLLFNHSFHSIRPIPLPPFHLLRSFRTTFLSELHHHRHRDVHYHPHCHHYCCYRCL